MLELRHGHGHRNTIRAQDRELDLLSKMEDWKGVVERSRQILRERERLLGVCDSTLALRVELVRIMK